MSFDTAPTPGTFPEGCEPGTQTWDTFWNAPQVVETAPATAQTVPGRAEARGLVVTTLGVMSATEWLTLHEANPDQF